MRQRATGKRPCHGKYVEIEGNACPRGEEYAIRELTCPPRLVTATVAMRGGMVPRLPVRTARQARPWSPPVPYPPEASAPPRAPEGGRSRRDCRT